MVDEDPVAAVGQVKGDILVGLLAAGAAVLVPDVHHLAVLDKGGKAFAQPVDAFAHPQRKLFVRISIAAHLGDTHAMLFAGGNQEIVGPEIDAPVVAERNASR